MIAKTGPVRIWHWAHLARNPDCTVAAESEWHLAWKALGPEGSQEIVVGNRRADVLAPGGFAVEFQASALDQEEIGAREGDWAAHGGMAWVFRADQAAIEVTEFFPSRWKPFLKEENLATLKVTWRYAPQRVRAARASSFLDLGNDELLFRRAAEEGPWEKQRTAAPPAGDVLRAVEDLLKTGSASRHGHGTGHCHFWRAIRDNARESGPAAGRRPAGGSGHGRARGGGRRVIRGNGLLPLVGPVAAARPRTTPGEFPRLTARA